MVYLCLFRMVYIAHVQSSVKQWVSSIQAGSAVGAEEELVDVLFSVQLFGWFSAQAEP